MKRFVVQCCFESVDPYRLATGKRSTGEFSKQKFCPSSGPGPASVCCVCAKKMKINFFDPNSFFFFGKRKKPEKQRKHTQRETAALTHTHTQTAHTHTHSTHTHRKKTEKRKGGQVLILILEDPIAP